MVELRSPDPTWHEAWSAMAAEFGGGHVDGSGLHHWTVAELADPELFRAWVSQLAAQERGEDVPKGWVAASLRWVTEGDEVVGTIALRHELTDFLVQEGGHIGYAVRPTARRRGVATRALALMLGECRVRGIDPVLVTCDEDNAASARTIEINGGVLEDVRNGKRRYWITLSDR